MINVSPKTWYRTGLFPHIYNKTNNVQNSANIYLFELFFEWGKADSTSTSDFRNYKSLAYKIVLLHNLRQAFSERQIFITSAIFWKRDARHAWL